MSTEKFAFFGTRQEKINFYAAGNLILFRSNIFMLPVVATLLMACSSQPVETPFITKISECSRIADRSERTRCIDAANRSDIQSP